MKLFTWAKNQIKQGKEVSLVDSSFHQWAKYSDVEQAAYQLATSTEKIKRHLYSQRPIKDGLRVVWTKNLPQLREDWLKNREMLLENARKKAEYRYGNDEHLIKQYMNNFILNL
jgi:hypothetical protein